VVIRRSDASDRLNDASDGLNDRLGKALKGKRLARGWKDLRHVLMGMTLILVISLAVLLLLVPS